MPDPCFLCQKKTKDGECERIKYSHTLSKKVESSDWTLSHSEVRYVYFCDICIPKFILKMKQLETLLLKPINSSMHTLVEDDTIIEETETLDRFDVMMIPEEPPQRPQIEERNETEL
tara:strand:- start:1276 stop:1626 length:351 start_codon:yes stop_codon:yes gene_type:complete